jgi:hypothetical protein
LIFGILCAVSLVFINRFVPETKGKSHEADSEKNGMDSKEKDNTASCNPLHIQMETLH